MIDPMKRSETPESLGECMKAETSRCSPMAFGGLWLVFWGAGLAVLAAGFQHLHGEGAAIVLLGAGMEGVLAWAMFALAGKWERRFQKRHWPVFLMMASALLKIPALSVMKTYVQVMDRGYYLSFVQRLAAEGVSLSSIGDMARSVYDFYSFFPRSFALALPVRLMVGEAATVPVHQGICFVLAVLSTWMVYEILRFLFDESVARRASLLHLLFPLRNITFLDFAHQVPGEFILLLGLLSLLRIMQPGGALRLLAWGVGLATSLGLGHLLIGVDGLVWCLGGGLLALAWRSVPVPGRLRRVGWMGVSMALALAAIQFFSAWQRQVAPAPLSSGQPGFMARGWSFRAGGEYDPWLEVVDREAPPAVRGPLMRAYVRSQIVNAPLRVFGRLLPEKAVKYFLPGFASGTEQALAAGGHRWGALLFTGARVFFAAGLLAAMILGCLRVKSEKDSRGTTFCLLYLGVFGLIQVLLGETSPRYAFYLHFLMLGVAACGLDFRRALETGAAWLFWGGVHVGVYAALAMAAWAAVGFAGEAGRLRDLGEVVVEPEKSQWTPDPVDSALLGSVVLDTGDAATIRLALSDIPETHSQLHVLVSAERPAGWEMAGSGMDWRVLRPVQGVVLDLPSPASGHGDASEVRLLFRRMAGQENPVALRVGIGYILTGDFQQHE